MGILLALLPIVASMQADQQIREFANFPDAKPTFIGHIDFFRTARERDFGRELEVGTSGRNFDSLIDSVCCSIYRSQVPHIKDEPVSSLAKRILLKVDTVVSSSGIKLNPLGRKWLFAEASCAWVMRMVRYDSALATNPDPGAILKTQDSKSILAMDEPAQVCSGRTMLIRDLTNSAPSDLGIRCDRIGGWFRDMGKPTPKNSNHAWVLFDFGEGIRVPADAALGVDQAWLSTQTRKVNRAWILPTYRESWEFFLAGHHGEIRPPGEENKDVYRATLKDTLTGLTYSEWARTDTAGLVKLETFLRNDANW